MHSLWLLFLWLHKMEVNFLTYSCVINVQMQRRHIEEILKKDQFITVKSLYPLRKLFSTRESFCITMVFQTCILLNCDENILITK